MICMWLYDNNRVWISYERTFWCKFLTGITFMWADRPMKYWKTESYSSNGFLHIPLRSVPKMEEKDDAYFHSGEFKNYRS